MFSYDMINKSCMNSTCKECPKYKIRQVSALGLLSSESNSVTSEGKPHIQFWSLCFQS